MKKGLAVWDQGRESKGWQFEIRKREKVEKLKVKKKKQEKRFRGDFLFFFIFCLRGCRERIV